MSYTHIFRCDCNNGQAGMHELRIIAHAGGEHVYFALRSEHPGECVLLKAGEVRKLRDALDEWLKTWPANKGS